MSSPLKAGEKNGDFYEAGTWKGSGAHHLPFPPDPGTHSIFSPESFVLWEKHCGSVFTVWTAAPLTYQFCDCSVLMKVAAL